LKLRDRRSLLEELACTWSPPFALPRPQALVAGVPIDGEVRVGVTAQLKGNAVVLSLARLLRPLFGEHPWPPAIRAIDVAGAPA
jgi:hypothetical protein